MIRNSEQVREIVEQAVGTAYMGWPQTKIPKTVKGRPWAVVVLLDSQPIMKDRNGKTIQALLSYSVRIFASSDRELLDVCEKVEDAFAGILDKKGMSPSWNDPTHGLCRTMAFDRIMDIRNITYSN